MQSSELRTWAYAWVLGAFSGVAAVGWLGLSGTYAGGLVVAFILVAWASSYLAGRGACSSAETVEAQAGSEDEDLRQEYKRLLSQGTAQLQAQCGHMRDEIARTDSLLSDAITALTQSFSGIHEQAVLQRQFIQAVLDGQASPFPDGALPCASPNSSAAESEGASHPAEALAAASHAGDRMAEEVSRAITALQFHDMVSQLIGHLKKRVDALDDLAGQCGDLAIALHEATADDDLQRILNALRQAVNGIPMALDDAAVTTAHNPVSQSAMSHGNIELF